MTKKLVVFFTLIAGIVNSCSGLGLQPPPVPQEHKEVVLGKPATLECLVTPQTNAKGRWFLFDGQTKTQVIDSHGSVMDGYELLVAEPLESIICLLLKLPGGIRLCFVVLTSNAHLNGIASMLLLLIPQTRLPRLQACRLWVCCWRCCVWLLSKLA
ncbi:uncharacterized protein [Ptychodera flava]|uniref:uncharacterized protein n=1 Tax=Ptychodera flava TaxID=63121 RepID=UPI00396A120D